MAPAALNERSLAALEAGIASICFATVDRRGKQAEFICHQSRILNLSPCRETFVCRYVDTSSVTTDGVSLSEFKDQIAAISICHSHQYCDIAR